MELQLTADAWHRRGNVSIHLCRMCAGWNGSSSSNGSRHGWVLRMATRDWCPQLLVKLIKSSYRLKLVNITTTVVMIDISIVEWRMNIFITRRLHLVVTGDKEVDSNHLTKYGIINSRMSMVS